MLNRSALIYEYDGSFEGLMCCIFESYYKNEIPENIVPSYEAQLTFFPIKKITTDISNANRVIASIPKKIGSSALEFIQCSFLTCLPKKELYILLFLRMGYKVGPSIMNMLSDDTVSKLFKAVKSLENESHLLKGFIRFSIFKGALVAEIEPKNCVLPLIGQHFAERYREESFLIYDKTNSMALIYKPYKASIVPVEDMKMPELDEDEKYFRQLWGLYYKTVEIEGRHNPKCRMSHMPKRYWKYMTEFSYKGGSL